MKIEAGKFYRDRDGKIIGPMERKDSEFTRWPFMIEGAEGDDKDTWTVDGVWSHDTTQASRYDLIEEVADPRALAPHEAEERFERGKMQGDVIDLSDAIRQADEINCTVPRIVIPGYETLADTLQSALDQSQVGKGKERHARGQPFDRQPIMEIGRMVGIGYPTGQASKKIQEAVGMFNRDEADRAVNELLGAIVYASAAILLIREKKGI